jgi:hypothetical protein
VSLSVPLADAFNVTDVNLSCHAAVILHKAVPPVAMLLQEDFSLSGLVGKYISGDNLNCG